MEKFGVLTLMKMLYLVSTTANMDILERGVGVETMLSATPLTEEEMVNYYKGDAALQNVSSSYNSVGDNELRKRALLGFNFENFNPSLLLKAVLPPGSNFPNGGGGSVGNSFTNAGNLLNPNAGSSFNGTDLSPGIQFGSREEKQNCGNGAGLCKPGLVCSKHKGGNSYYATAGNAGKCVSVCAMQEETSSCLIPLPKNPFFFSGLQRLQKGSCDKGSCKKVGGQTCKRGECAAGFKCRGTSAIDKTRAVCARVFAKSGETCGGNQECKLGLHCVDAKGKVTNTAGGGQCKPLSICEMEGNANKPCVVEYNMSTVDGQTFILPYRGVCGPETTDPCGALINTPCKVGETKCSEGLECLLFSGKQFSNRIVTHTCQSSITTYTTTTGVVATTTTKVVATATTTTAAITTAATTPATTTATTTTPTTTTATTTTATTTTATTTTATTTTTTATTTTATTTTATTTTATTTTANACCRAFNAKCRACAEGISVFEYCEKNPTTQGCSCVGPSCGPANLLPGRYSLKGGRAHLNCADEGDKVICNRNHIKSWEKFTIEKHGDKYALKGGKNGKYCADEGHAVKCNRDWVRSWEKFTIEKRGGKYSLKGGKNGKYCADEHLNVICNRDHVQSWERFTITRVKTAPQAMLRDGKYALKGGNRNKHCADEGHKVVCNRNHIKSWEKFTLEKHGNRYALKGGKNGKYCADEGHKIKCNREWVRSWEKFTIQKHGGRYSLKGGKNGKYCADQHFKVICNRNNVQGWEKFRFIPL